MQYTFPLLVIDLHLLWYSSAFHMGVAVNLLPTGQTMPIISLGGTSLLTSRYRLLCGNKKIDAEENQPRKRQSRQYSDDLHKQEVA